MSLESQMGNSPSFTSLVELNALMNEQLLFSETATLSSVMDIYARMGKSISSLHSEYALGSRHYVPKYFTKQEFINSVTAQRRKIHNTFDAGSDLDMWFRHLCRVLLDPAREELKHPIMISSGYRCSALNKIVGGVANSLHQNCRAADLVCYDNDKLYDILYHLPHRELIKHPTYIHVAI